VINKMLTDLDQRQADASGAKPRRTGAADGLIQGAVPLTNVSLETVKSKRSVWIGWVAILLVTALAVWYWQNNDLDGKLKINEPVVSVLARAPLPPALESRPMPSAAVAVSHAVSEGVKGAVQSGVERQKNSLAKGERITGATTYAPAPVAVTTAMNAAAEPAAESQGLRMDSKLTRLPLSSDSSKVSQQPAMNGHSALNQAQALWSSGSHAAAIELVQQALAHLESSDAAAGPVTGQSPLAVLARELARMYLAEGQVRPALALLTRLEPQLSQVADLWAMRGNAAQRLGQHAEAVKCYKQALSLKPDEPRWMAGQAVSLAAQGQLAAAGELAESARSLGALRPEVATYLRQLGVSVRAD
jgi:hypothetical protein